MPPKALERLLERTLDSNKIKKDTKSQRKQKKKNVAKIMAAKEAADPERAAKLAAKQKKKNLKALTEDSDAEMLKKEILKSLSERVTYVKKVRKQHSFPGLTPGLAPVGYDPDESDEDEPY